jgi:hypothetical protein
MEHLRDVVELRRLRGRRAAVVVCRDDAAQWEPHRAALDAHDAELILEPAGGPVSARAGRPSVVVCDRWLDVVRQQPDAAPEAVVATVSWLGTCCDECPQVMLEPGGEAWCQVPVSL